MEYKLVFRLHPFMKLCPKMFFPYYGLKTALYFRYARHRIPFETDEKSGADFSGNASVREFDLPGFISACVFLIYKIVDLFDESE